VGPGAVIAAGAAPGTSVAAAQWFDRSGIHIRVYYQDMGGNIDEQSADSGQWQTDRSFAAAPGSGLAAAHWLDIIRGAHVRVYYQDSQNVIREQCYDTGAWAAGQFVLPTR
jgi:hypothetical protein